MFSKMISVLVLVLMFTSIDCQSNQSICDYILKEGRVKDLGLYRFVSKEGNSSYRLFSRDTKDCPYNNCGLTKEYELEITNSSVSARPSPITEPYGVHKFYAGYSKLNSVYTNCRVGLVSLLR